MAAYGLNPANLHHNWLGYLSELPPDAYEFSKRVRKQVKTTPDSLVGYTATLAGYICPNLSEEDKENNWKFPVAVYLEEADKIELYKNKNRFKLYLKRLTSYTCTQHVKPYAILVFIHLTAFITAGIAYGLFLLCIEPESLPHDVKSTLTLINHITAFCLILCIVLYLRLWRISIRILESPRKSKNYIPSAPLDEVKKWIKLSTQSKTDWKNEAKKIIDHIQTANQNYNPNTKAKVLDSDEPSEEQKERVLQNYISSLHETDYVKLFGISTNNPFSVILLMLAGKLQKHEKRKEQERNQNKGQGLNQKQDHAKEKDVDKPKLSTTEEVPNWIAKDINSKNFVYRPYQGTI